MGKSRLKPKNNAVFLTSWMLLLLTQYGVVSVVCLLELNGGLIPNECLSRLRGKQASHANEIVYRLTVRILSIADNSNNIWLCDSYTYTYRYELHFMQHTFPFGSTRKFNVYGGIIYWKQVPCNYLAVFMLRFENCACRLFAGAAFSTRKRFNLDPILNWLDCAIIFFS